MSNLPINETDEKYLRERKRLHDTPSFIFGIVVLFIMVFILLFFCGKVRAEINTRLIDVNIIAKIESNGNPLAYNKKSEARGLCQITPICLEDFENFAKHYTPINYVNEWQLYDPWINLTIANWYINERIPDLIRNLYAGAENNIDNRLICYNWGIGKWRKWWKAGHSFKALPRETRNYIKRYHSLADNK